MLQFNLDGFDRIFQLAIAGFIIISITNLGGIFERRKWAFVLEIGRWGVLLIVGCYHLIEWNLIFAITILLLTLLTITWLLRYRSIFRAKLSV